jgi:hypothetical protein
MIPLNPRLGCSQDAHRLKMMVNMSKNNAQKVQDRQFAFQLKGLRQKEPRQKFSFGIEQFEHVDFQSFMVSTPNIHEKGG